MSGIEAFLRARRIRLADGMWKWIFIWHLARSRKDVADKERQRKQERKQESVAGCLLIAFIVFLVFFFFAFFTPPKRTNDRAEQSLAARTKLEAELRLARNNLTRISRQYDEVLTKLAPFNKRRDEQIDLVKSNPKINDNAREINIMLIEREYAKSTGTLTQRAEALKLELERTKSDVEQITAALAELR